jgi:hypothetical protein
MRQKRAGAHYRQQQQQQQQHQRQKQEQKKLTHNPHCHGNVYGSIMSGLSDALQHLLSLSSDRRVRACVRHLLQVLILYSTQYSIYYNINLHFFVHCCWNI